MSERRDLSRSDRTTLSEGLVRNALLERITKFAEYSGLNIGDVIEMSRRESLAAAEDEEFSNVEVHDATGPLDILKRTLSIRSVLSTNSSFAERMEALASVDLKDLKLNEIGRGSFGTVFEIPGTEWCLKKTLTSVSHLRREYSNGVRISREVNNTAWEAISRSNEFPGVLMPRVPRYIGWYGMEDSESPSRWFKTNGHMFPQQNGGKVPGPVICLERVLPLPKVIRESLIEHYFKPEDREAALADKENKACICRVYLGYRSDDIQKQKLEDERKTLRNFPLYLDQMMELEMDPLVIARDMALGLAAGHWAANSNMMDVEYVIGSRPHMVNLAKENPPARKGKKATAGDSRRRHGNLSAPVDPRPDQPTFRNRAIQLWMIDFNKVNQFEASVTQGYNKNIDRLVFESRATDGPYYPRVLARDEYEWKLWLEFARTYIRASRTILNDMMEKTLKTTGVRFHSSEVELAMKRPSRVMNEWMKAEAHEAGVTSKKFKKMLRENNWEMP